jgi:hypothetical protein
VPQNCPAHHYYSLEQAYTQAKVLELKYLLDWVALYDAYPLSSLLNTNPQHGTVLAKGYTVTKTALAASHREWSGEYAMAKPHDTQNHEVFQEDPMVTELLAELQAMDEKARVEAQFYELVAWISHIDGPYQNDRESSMEFSTW